MYHKIETPGATKKRQVAIQSQNNEMAVSLVMAREMDKSRFLMELGEASSRTVGSQLPLPMK